MQAQVLADKWAYAEIVSITNVLMSNTWGLKTAATFESKYQELIESHWLTNKMTDFTKYDFFVGSLNTLTETFLLNKDLQ